MKEAIESVICVILDIFSRYAIGWMLAEQEMGALAELLIVETCRKQGIERVKLTLWPRGTLDLTHLTITPSQKRKSRRRSIVPI